MLKDMMERAIKKKQELLEANETNTRIIDNIIKALKHEQVFNDLPQSTCFNIFVYLGYPVKILEYEEMYKQLMEEVNKKYIYMNPEDFKRGL